MISAFQTGAVEGGFPEVAAPRFRAAGKDLINSPAAEAAEPKRLPVEFQMNLRPSDRKPAKIATCPRRTGTDEEVKGPQTKYLVPLKMRIIPMRITETAAIRSPKKRALKERREAESPVKKKAGTVPRPKEVVIRKPTEGFPVEAALTIMAQESMQGRKPAARPRASFEERL